MVTRQKLAKYDFEFSENESTVITLKKSCLKCKQYKPVSDFKNYQYYCIDNNWCAACIKQHKTPHKTKYSQKYYYQAKYGETKEHIYGLLKGQLGLCANRACGKEISLEYKAKNRAFVDHCHATGKVRGILCVSCNTALGHLENKNKMLGLTEYLQKYST